MKSVELPTRPSQEKWRNPQDAGSLLPSSTYGPIPSSTGYDSADASLQESDRTRAFLHQLSQTLTSLRGTLELALLVDCDAQDYRRAIQQSLVQAEGLVQLFKSYRASAQGGTACRANQHELLNAGIVVRKNTGTSPAAGEKSSPSASGVDNRKV